MPERQPDPGERLWTLRKADHVMHAELRDHGAIGVEVQIFSRGEPAAGCFYPTRASALEPAGAWRRDLEANGWQA